MVNFVSLWNVFLCSILSSLIFAYYLLLHARFSSLFLCLCHRCEWLLPALCLLLLLPLPLLLKTKLPLRWGRLGWSSGDFLLCCSQVPSRSDAVFPKGEYHLGSWMGAPKGVLVRSAPKSTLAPARRHAVPPSTALLPRQELPASGSW